MRRPRLRRRALPDDRALTKSAPADPAPAGPAIAWRALGVFSFCFLVTGIVRNANSVLGEPAAVELGATASALGVLTAAYFFTFALAQIPIGIALDRYGPRRALAVLIGVGALGAMLYAQAGSVLELTLARAVVGLGFGGVLMAAFTANSLFFPADRVATANALTMAAGGLGALAATTPLALLGEATGWRVGYAVIAGAALLCVPLLLFVAPRAHGRGRRDESLRQSLRGVGRVFRSAVFWRYAPPAALAQGALLAYLSLWIAGWLRTVEGMSPAATADVLAFVAVASMLGALGVAALAEREARRGRGPARLLNAGVVATAGVLFLLGAGIGDGAVLWVIFMLVVSATATSYAAITAAFPSELAGRANTLLNLMVFITAFTLQAAIGVWVDGPVLGSANAHREAAMMIGALCLLSLGAVMIKARGAR